MIVSFKLFFSIPITKYTHTLRIISLKNVEFISVLRHIVPPKQQQKIDYWIFISFFIPESLIKLFIIIDYKRIRVGHNEKKIGFFTF